MEHPSLGNSRKEIYAAWEKADIEYGGGGFTIVGLVPAYGIFGWLHGHIIRLRSDRFTYEIASQADLDEIDRSILSGTFQVEMRPKNGAALTYSTMILHQATGRPLVEDIT
jgi:hypothetical protein